MKTAPGQSTDRVPEELIARTLALAVIPARTAAPAQSMEDVRVWDHIGDPIAEAFVRAVREHQLTKMDPVDAARLLADRGVQAGCDFLDDVNYVPEWARFEEMKAGERLGRRSVLGTAVAIHGALPVTYIDYNVTDLMTMTGRLNRQGDFARRMWETFTGFVGALDVDQMQPGGREWHRWVLIRVMHTRVRMGVLSSGKWDLTQRPMPISALGTAACVYAFGIYRANLCREFARASREELEGYALTWRWVARIVGAPPELLADTAIDQLRIDIATIRALHHPDQGAAILAGAAYEGMSEMFPYSLAPRRVHEALARYVLDPARLIPPYVEERVAASGDHSLVEALATLRTEVGNLGDTYRIPPRPVLTQMIAITAKVMRTISAVTHIPQVDRVIQGANTKVIAAVVGRGLAGTDATYDTHMDRAS